MASKQLEAKRKITGSNTWPSCSTLQDAIRLPCWCSTSTWQDHVTMVVSYIDKQNARIQVDQFDLQTAKELKSLETHLETRLIQSLHLVNIFLQRQSPRSVQTFSTASRYDIWFDYNINIRTIRSSQDQDVYPSSGVICLYCVFSNNAKWEGMPLHNDTAHSECTRPIRMKAMCCQGPTGKVVLYGKISSSHKS